MAVTQKFIIIKNGVPLYGERMDYKFGGGREFFISDSSEETRVYTPHRFDTEFMNDKKYSILRFLENAEAMLFASEEQVENLADVLTEIEVAKLKIKKKDYRNPPLFGIKGNIYDVMKAVASVSSGSDDEIDYEKEAEAVVRVRSGK